MYIYHFLENEPKLCQILTASEFLFHQLSPAKISGQSARKKVTDRPKKKEPSKVFHQRCNLARYARVSQLASLAVPSSLRSR